MPATLPVGDPVPEDGSLPDQVNKGALQRAFGVYIHVPFCTVRCGYCDFNTYTHEDLPGVSTAEYHRFVMAELDYAHATLERSGLPHRPVSTVFFGGGTPSLMEPEQIDLMLTRTRELWGVLDGVEVTMEANPDSLALDRLPELVESGVTRFSLGMQSANPEVLAVLERTHEPDRVAECVAAIREVGAAISADVIYGSPGETLSMWRETVREVVALGVDHVSAYSLIVEPGTALHRKVARGEYDAPSDDLHAQMYEVADDLFSEAGFHWYEVSNWSKDSDSRSRHNLGYWRSDDWWGVGPGSHSHVGGVRWWNAKHPTAWVKRLEQGRPPAVGREVLDDHTRWVESVLLRLRTSDGMSIESLSGVRPETISSLIAEGYIDGASALSGTVVLTRKGRLMADWVVGVVTG